MIQLIACDIDGTLLRNGATEIDPQLFRLIRRLKEKEILFCPTSGRQYDSLRLLFRPVAQELFCICENGAVTFDPDGTVLAKNAMEHEAALELAEDILRIPQAEVLISGENMSYLVPKHEKIVRVVRDGLKNNVTLLKATEDIPEEIVKVSAFCPEGIDRAQEMLQNKWGFRFQAAIAGECWLDFSSLHSDKGVAVRRLCQKLGIPLQNVMAFGDNYNDLPVLRIVGAPYLMCSAADELRRQFPRQCSSVTEKLETLLL